MQSLKTQFSELRKNTPKHVQWLLLAAAFIVVLILLVLLLKGDKNPVAEPTETVPASIAIDPDTVDWTTTKVGEVKTQTFTVMADKPVKIDAVRPPSNDVPGLSKPKTTCPNIGISDKVSCTISVEYAPTIPADVSGASLFVDWHDASQLENIIKRTDKITIAVAATPVAKPEPEPESEPEHKPAAPAPIVQEKVAPIIPSVPVVPEPSPAPLVVAAPALQLSAEDCSDFAFPGYGASGQQIGWIRPKGGAYFFHPFSDKNCDSPTGTYNPDNGIIMDINNSGRKIGTDADHIGYASITNGAIPQLSNPVAPKNVNRARQLESADLAGAAYGTSQRLSVLNPGFVQKTDKIMTSSGTTVVSSAPYDRTFILRQYKPIPATIVSEIRAEQRLITDDHILPIIATVDRNVYSDNGRTIIVPTGTTLYGYVTGDMPGPYKAIGRMQVNWYQFVRPDGVEFNFGTGQNPFSGDAQGRIGVPGRGSTDYLEQFVMPMLTAVVPAAVNMIAPISDRFVNQIDLDNNTVTQSGQVRSSELAKNEIVTAWNKVAQKLLVDMMDNTVPPFSIAAGTRITVFSPVDLLVTCGAPTESNKKCAIETYGSNPRVDNPGRPSGIGESAENAGSMTGQVRSFDMDGYCKRDANGNFTGGVNEGQEKQIQAAGYDYRTVLFYCQSAQYKAINNAKQAAVYQNQQTTSNAVYDDKTKQWDKLQTGTQKYNENVLGLNYNDNGTVQNPFKQLPVETPPAALQCEDKTAPDANGCCTGETYTDMGADGFNCCPAAGGDCFPPMT
ncbi:MAG: hypothetical protein LBJ73_05125 [Rickettsiales bacterium]|jgi:type IV secretory pathway VirB10-like protein|nr:hypothetical protein [Rickettsiales bacterium]